MFSSTHTGSRLEPISNMPMTGREALYYEQQGQAKKAAWLKPTALRESRCSSAPLRSLQGEEGLASFVCPGASSLSLWAMLHWFLPDALFGALRGALRVR